MNHVEKLQSVLARTCMNKQDETLVNVAFSALISAYYKDAQAFANWYGQELADFVGTMLVTEAMPVVLKIEDTSSEYSI